jgi:hypothetical protein
VVHTCDPNTHEDEAGGFEFKAKLGLCIKSLFQKTNNQKKVSNRIPNAYAL